MRTIEQAVAEETRRYVQACAFAAKTTGDERARWMTDAHTHFVVRQALLHNVVTPHEAICAATPTVHAHGAVRTRVVGLAEYINGQIHTDA